MPLITDSSSQSDLRKEADREREGAELQLKAAAEKRQRNERQRLEGDRNRLIQRRDEQKRQYDELLREIANAKHAKVAAEEIVREVRAERNKHGGNQNLEHEEQAIRERIREIATKRAHVPHVSVRTDDVSASTALDSIGGKLKTAESGLEQATLEHSQVLTEIKQLERTLIEKKEQERGLKNTIAKAVEDIRSLREDHKTAKQDHLYQEKMAKDTRALEEKAKETLRLLDEEEKAEHEKLAEIENKRRAHASEKGEQEATARSAEEEERKATATIHELERREAQVKKEIELMEGNIHVLDAKLQKLT